MYDRQQPSPAFAALEASKVADGPKVCVLHDVFGVMLVVCQPPGEIVGCV
jgi:hypothetical protein